MNVENRQFGVNNNCAGSYRIKRSVGVEKSIILSRKRKSSSALTDSSANEDILKNISARKFTLEHKESVRDMVEVSRILKSMFFVNSQLSAKDAHDALENQHEEMRVSGLRIAELGTGVSHLKLHDYYFHNEIIPLLIDKEKSTNFCSEPSRNETS